jgi:hypothetical protein
MHDQPRRPRIRFGLRTLFELIAVVAFILTLLYYRQTAIKATGRYHLHQVTSTSPPRVLVIDTQTGRVWETAGTDWFDYGQPPSPAK